jgi:hypothetical protein
MACDRRRDSARFLWKRIPAPVKESNVEIVRMPPSEEELEQIKQQKLDQEQRILQNLK